MKKSNYKFLLIMLIGFIFSQGAKAQCVASFNYNTNGSGVITLLSTSDSIYNVTWVIDRFDTYYGDITTIILPNDSHEVCMIIEDSASSCADTTCQYIFVGGGNTSCNASISYIDNGGGNITFSGNTSAGMAATFSWNFGDGNSSSLQNPTHTYANSGTYIVEFIVVDSNCTDTVSQPVTIGTNNTCTVVPSFSVVDNGNGTFTFTDASTTSSGGSMFGTWFFGDGAIGYTDEFNNSISHTYTANGVYVVVLEAYDSLDNCTAYLTQTIVVNGVNSPVACNAAFVMFPDSLFNNQFIVVNSSTGSNLTYFWDFGDGNTSTQAYPNYTYTTAGPFELCLTVSDGSGCTSTYCDSISDGGIILKQGGFTINVISPSSTLDVDDVVNFSSLNVYPNPVKELLNIEMDLVKNTTVELLVTDITGKVVSNITNGENVVGSKRFQLNVQNFKNGIYFLNIKTNHQNQVMKIMINK